MCSPSRLEDGDQVERVIREAAEIRLALPHLRGLTLALQHAAQLRADMLHQLEETGGRFGDNPGEKFHHPHHARPREQRKREGRGQSKFTGESRAGWLRLRVDLPRPRRLAAGQHIARQAGVVEKFHRRGESAKRLAIRRTVGVAQPCGNQRCAGPAGFLHRQHMPERPVVMPAELFQRGRDRLREGLRLVRRHRDRLQQHQMLLLLVKLADGRFREPRGLQPRGALLRGLVAQLLQLVVFDPHGLLRSKPFRRPARHHARDSIELRTCWRRVRGPMIRRTFPLKPIPTAFTLMMFLLAEHRVHRRIPFRLETSEGGARP